MRPPPDLLSVWFVDVVRRSWLLLSLGVVLGAGVGVIAVIASDPSYETDLMFRVGRVHRYGPIEPAEVLTARASKLLDDEGPESCTWRVTWVGPPQSTVYVRMTCRDPDVLMDLAEKVSTWVVDRHARMYEHAVDPGEDSYLEHLESTVAQLESELAGDRLDEAGRIEVTWLHADLQREKYQIRLRRNSLYTYPTSVVRAPSRPERTSNPKIATVLISTLLGLAFGVTGAAVWPRAGRA